MSRDFTPRDMILAEELINLKNGMLMRDVIWNLKGNDEMADKERLESLRRTYPEMTLLVSHMETLDEIATTPWAREFMARIEKRLAQMRDQVIDGTLPEAEEHDVVARWYCGTLVPGYYMDDNSEAFMQWMIKNINERNKAYAIKEETENDNP